MVDWFNQVAVLGVDEAQLVTGEGGADEFEFVSIDADVSLAGGFVHNDHIDIAGDESLHSEIELVKPTTNDSGVARYLEKRGPGMHHLCFEVEDIQAKLDQLKAQGVQLINETATELGNGTKIAFIHPKSSNGVLVELYELP